MTDRPDQLPRDESREASDAPTALDRRIAEVYRAPELTAVRRQAFDTALLERIDDAAARGPWLRAPALLSATTLAVAAAAWLLVWRLPNPEPQADGEDPIQVTALAREPAPIFSHERVAPGSREEIGRDGMTVDGVRIDLAGADLPIEPRRDAIADAMFAITTESVVDESESLPDDYAAINSLFFGG